MGNRPREPEATRQLTQLLRRGNASESKLSAGEEDKEIGCSRKFIGYAHVLPGGPDEEFRAPLWTGTEIRLMVGGAFQAPRR